MRKSLETLRKSALQYPEEDVVDISYLDGVDSVEGGGIARGKSEGGRTEGTWGKLTGLWSRSAGPVTSSAAATADGSDESVDPSSVLSSLMFSGLGDDSDWLKSVAESSWLTHCSAVLCAAARVATVINRDAVSVLVHCSDGWDRTTQVCALAQLILDPYFRTLNGFAVLVDKEWVSFGHKFTDRLGFDAAVGYQSSERSPIFLQVIHLD